MGRLIFILFLGFAGGAFAEERMTLDQFLTQVRSENLNLKIESAGVESARSGEVGVSLPPPMLGLSRMQDETGSALGYEINQTIPFPAKLTHDHSARQLDAKARVAFKRATEVETQAEARLLYFSLWQSQQKISLLHEKKEAIQNHIKLATAGARSDNFLKIHIVKAESDLDLLENDILSAEQENRDRQSQVAQMLNRSTADFKPVAEEPQISKLPLAEALKKPFQIETRVLRVESFRARESEAKSSWLPDFNIRYREMSGTTMSPRFTEVMVGASLPFLFFWEPSSLSAKASAERLQEELSLENEKRKIENRQATLFAKALTLQKQLRMFTEKLLPRAEKRMHMVHNLAPRDMETLQDHRETLEVFPDLKMKALELRGQYEETVAELQKYSSEDLK